MKHIYYVLLLFMPAICYGQTITGTVHDAQNEPLAGITVTASGARNQAVTNEKGGFQINISVADKYLRFSATGLEPVEIEIAGKKDILVTMIKRSNKLDEVQIIAYGTNTQRYNVGSVTKVTAEEIGKQAISNPLEALQGRVPGLTIAATSGIPGASFNVQIRGQNTLKPSTSFISPKDNPLFIIDGVPFAPQNGNINQFSSLASPGIGNLYNNAYGGLSPFNSINPNDIESIEVLRDADATAIYGSRGGNGVILITTKKGKAGKTDFNLNVRDGVSFIGKTMPMMNTQQYLSMRKEAFANDGLTPNTTLYDAAYAPDLTIFDTTRYTDWKKVFLGNTARNLNVATSISGGNENTQFRIGGGFNRDTYIFPGDFSDDRENFATNIHHTSSNRKFSIDFSATYSYDKNNSSGAPNILSAYTLEPNYPALIDAQGNLIWDYKGVSLDGSYAGSNPFAYLKRLYKITNLNLNSNVLLAYQVFKGLTIRTSFGYNTFDSKEYSNTPQASQNPAFNPSSLAKFGNNNLSTWIAEPQIEYKSNYKKNSYSILIGSTFQRNASSKTETDGYGYINDALLGSISGATTTSSSDAFSEYKYSAVFGRISYRFDNKYLFNINGRRDGSSRFGPSKQFGDFGSVGAGWLFSEESLIKNNVPILSFGKLRASYGITGSDAIADYQYVSRYAPAKYTYGGNLGYLPQNLYNPQLSWASTKKLEFGLELGFIQDRVLLNAGWYRNRSGDQLITYQLPAQTGFQTVYENWNAVVQNTGWEISIQSTIIKSSRFSWNSSFNLTIPQNKLLSFPGIENSSYSTTYFIGKSVNTVTGFNYAGVDPATGLFQFAGASGQITSTPAYASQGKLNDYIIIGNTDPKFYGGFQNSFSYKGVQLDFFIEFKKQLGLNYLSQVYSLLPGLEQNLPVSLLQRWQSPGQQAQFQRFSSQYGQEYDAANNFVQSSGVYSDASYLRLKTATLSYNIPAGFLGKINVRSLKIFATAQNLFTVTNYKGNDPETQNFYGIPPLKTISFGLNLNL
ncbi:MAG: SusC/RagA family TonB-linked outer membrane protein [Bacteroidota bacterium]